MSDAPTDPAPAPAPPASTTRSPGGRRLAAATVTVLMVLFVANAVRVVYHDNYSAPPADPRDVSCSAGIRRLHGEYDALWRARREGRGQASSAGHDRALLALRAVCAREGDGAEEAYRRFERWRYRAEAAVFAWRENLDEDAARALGYRSPGTPDD